MRRALVIFATLAVALLLTGGATASATETCYPDCGGVGSEETGSTTTPTTAPETTEPTAEVSGDTEGGGTLPLTGGDVAGLVVVGGGLLVAGGALVVTGRKFLAA